MNGIVLAICLAPAALAVVALALFAVRTGRELRMGAVTREVVRRRLKVIGKFGALTGLTAAFPFAVASRAESDAVLASL